MDELEQSAYNFMNKEPKTKKPPLGIAPRHIWEERRTVELSNAVCRYLEAGRPVPMEWVEEFNELIKKVNPME